MCLEDLFLRWGILSRAMAQIALRSRAMFLGIKLSDISTQSGANQLKARIHMMYLATPNIMATPV